MPEGEKESLALAKSIWTLSRLTLDRFVVRTQRVNMRIVLTVKSSEAKRIEFDLICLKANHALLGDTFVSQNVFINKF